MKRLIGLAIAVLLSTNSIYAIEEEDFYSQVARSYDVKTSNTEHLNSKLAETDGLYFNHNGLVAHGDEAAQFLEKIQSEKELLDLIHRLEKNTAYYGLTYLGCPKREDILLDAGCSAGGCSFIINRAFNCKMEGVNLSGKQVSLANTIASSLGVQERVQFSQGNMLSLPKPDNYYDGIWACESTEHIPDLKEMFQEFKRVSKPASRLVIIAWCANDPELKKTVDEHYVTLIHTANEYKEQATLSGWKLLHEENLSDRTAKYWDIRSHSKHATGSESFMGSGFATENLQYFLFTFQNDK